MHEIDTLCRVPYSEAQARAMALGAGFEMRYTYGAGNQCFWLWFFKTGCRANSSVLAVG